MQNNSQKCRPFVYICRHKISKEMEDAGVQSQVNRSEGGTPGGLRIQDRHEKEKHWLRGLPASWTESPDCPFM